MSIIEETLHRLGEQEAAQTDAQAIAARAIPMAHRRPVRSMSRMLLLGSGAIVVISAVAWMAPGMIGLPVSGGANPAQPGVPEKTASTTISAVPSMSQPIGGAEVEQSASGAPAGVTEQSSQTDKQPGRVESAQTPEPVKSKPEESAAVPVTAKTMQGEVPQWLTEGSSAMAKGDTDHAVQLWDNGLRTLGNRQMIVAVAAYRELAPAVAAWRRLSNYPDAMIVSGVYRKQPAYRVVVLSSPIRNQREQDLVQARQAVGVSGGMITTVGLLGRFSPEVKVLPQPSFDPLGKGLAPEPKMVSPTPNYVFEGQAEPAVQAMNRGDYREAIGLLIPLSEQYGKRNEPFLWLAKAELALGRYGDAEEHLSVITDRAPGMGEAWLLRGIAAQERGEHLMALKWLAEALRLQPNNPDVYFNLGYSQDALGRRAEAEMSWRRFFDLARDVPRYAKQRAYAEHHLTSPQR